MTRTYMSSRLDQARSLLSASVIGQHRCESAMYEWLGCPATASTAARSLWCNALQRRVPAGAGSVRGREGQAMSSRLLALNSFAPTDGAVASLTTHPSSSRACQPRRAMSGSALALSRTHQCTWVGPQKVWARQVSFAQPRQTHLPNNTSGQNAPTGMRTASQGHYLSDDMI